MSKEFIFFDYIDADGHRDNVIKNWLNGPGKNAKSYFTHILAYLEQTPLPWIKKYSKSLKGDWQGFIELRKTGRVQYRLIGKIVKRNIYLVACGIHKDQRYTTDISPQIASSRVSQMIKEPLTYGREHEYN
jgi:hypothetical protein